MNAQPLQVLSLLRLVVLPLALVASLAWGQENDALDIDDLKAFAEAWGRIKSQYVEPIDDHVLLEAAIRGMVSELDRHSSWLDEAQFARMEADALGRFGGLGVRIAIQPDHLQVVDTTPEGPAALAGLSPGDRILEIDGQTIVDGNSDAMALALRGPAGSTVELTVARVASGREEKLLLTRQVIRQESVFWQVIDKDQALIRITSFQQTTAVELDRAVEALLEAHEPRGVILDLRGNPGGMVQAAVAVSDRFLDEGLIVSAQARETSEQERFEANPGALLTGLPMAVLIDNQSASAAEILAAALRDHERATLIGERSYGKGSVQSIWPLSNGSALRLTTARYRTPAGRDLERAGVLPDIEVPYANAAGDAVLDAALDWMKKHNR
ncbi:MAG: S41 family peptidase [Pseudomonadota bacterium]